MPVKGEPDLDPAAIAVAEAFLAELEVPRRVKFTPSQLAADVGGTRRAWQQACANGDIEAVHGVGGWIVTRKGLIRFIARRHNLADHN